jgi:hypothetical protein
VSEHFADLDTVAFKCSRPPWGTWRGSEVMVTPWERAFAVVTAAVDKTLSVTARMAKTEPRGRTLG